MRLKELLESVDTNTPIVYLDMDGVIADLYNHAADLHDVDHYNHMTTKEWEAFFKDSDAYHLFRDVPAFSTKDDLINTIMKYAGSYRILSSPLSFDRHGSIKGKREWLAKNVNPKPEKTVFEHDKYKYAVQPNGTPNILIDDYGVNTRAWTAAGGIAVKYQADEDPVSKVATVLKKVFGKDK